MKSISVYLYNKRHLAFEPLFWGFWFLYFCFYIGSLENAFTSGVMFWSLSSVSVSYLTYRVIFLNLTYVFKSPKYLIYLALILIFISPIRVIINEITWQVALKYLDFGSNSKEYDQMINVQGGGFVDRVKFFVFSPFMFVIQAGRMFPASVRLFIELIAYQRKNNLLEKNRMDLEIKLLKSQINPQFINESLENIKIVVKTNVEKAELMTLKLSNMIRYTLYETDVEKVSLQKELDFMLNYIDLQETHLADHANVNLRLKTNALDGLTISPLLVFPLLEKAFRCIKSNCDIDIKARGSVVELKIEADCVPNCQHTGIESTQKRLTALYPNKYKLQVFENEGNFKVDLRLEL